MIKVKMEDSLREIPFEVLGWMLSWISGGEQAMINQVSKNFQLVINKEKFKIQISTAVSSVPVLQWSTRNGFPQTDKEVVGISIINGKLEVLKYLVTVLKYPLPDDSFNRAIYGGNLEIIKALRSGKLGKICSWDKWWSCVIAAQEGHLEVLKALRSGELGGVCPWDEWVCATAAQEDRLNVLRLLRSGELGGVCPWNECACENAAGKGHLEVLKALRSGELGGVCPWNKEECLGYSEDNQAVQDLILSGELDG